MPGIGAVFYREAKIRFTNVIYIFWDLFYPLGYLLVFGAAMNRALGPALMPGGTDYNSFFLAGVLGMASFGIAANTSWGFFVDRDNGIFYEMLTYPLTRSTLLLGKAVFNLLLALLQALLAIGLARLALGVPVRLDRLPLLLAGVVLGTAGWFFFYAIFALRIRRNDAYNTVTSIFYFVFLFASSMFYPLEPLPRWLQLAALGNPITWQVDVLRYSTIGWGHGWHIALESGGFLVFLAASFILAVRALGRQ